MYYVYVLLSKKDNRFYLGYTKDIVRRYKEHARGANYSTKHRRPLELIYYEAHNNPIDAKRREKYFKTSKGKSTLRQMLRNAIVP